VAAHVVRLHAAAPNSKKRRWASLYALDCTHNEMTELGFQLSSRAFANARKHAHTYGCGAKVPKPKPPSRTKSQGDQEAGDEDEDDGEEGEGVNLPPPNQGQVQVEPFPAPQVDQVEVTQVTWEAPAEGLGLPPPEVVSS
jgi:hypothetical protein